MALWRWGCRHSTLLRVKVDGAWYFACACGYRVPIVARTKDEIARMAARR